MVLELGDPYRCPWRSHSLPLTLQRLNECILFGSVASVAFGIYIVMT